MTLEDQLNAKADAEFKRIIAEMIGPIEGLAEIAGGHSYSGPFTPHTKLRMRDGSAGESIAAHVMALSEGVFETFKEKHREKFAARFLARVEAMQTEMESYIGELRAEEEPTE